MSNYKLNTIKFINVTDQIASSDRLCVYIAKKEREVYTGSNIVAVTKDENLVVWASAGRRNVL